MQVKMMLLDGGIKPTYQTKGASCADAYARLDEPVTIPQYTRMLIPLGFAVELPIGYELQVRPRSGWTKRGYDIGLGTVDCDYRGEVMATVINNTTDDLVIKNGDRICQLKVVEAPQIGFELVKELTPTERGSSGFGSTGV